MGGYWDASDLAQYVMRANMATYLIGPSTVPMNDVQFAQIILDNSLRFDQAAAKSGYLVPIPSVATAGFGLARAIVRNGCTADALRIINTGLDPKYADRYQTMFDQALKVIEVGDRPIPGAPPDPSADNRLLAAFGGGNPSAVITATMGYPQDLGIPCDW
jgi:hypothetical protein